MHFRRRWLGVLAALCLLSLTCFCAVGVSVPDMAEAEISSATNPEETAAPETSSSGEREFINTEPRPILPKTEPETIRPSGIIAWSVLFACVLGVILFVHNAKKENKNNFSARTAARSRWHRRRPTRSEMSKRYYHDRTHFRK